MNFFSTFVWDPDRIFFIVPYLNFPVFWYGFLFALGYQLEYLLLKPIIRHFVSLPSLTAEENKQEAMNILGRLTVWVTLCSVVGARLGYILFYGLPHYLAHPSDILNIRQGGLASHGAIGAVLLALWVIARTYKKRLPRLTTLALLDMIAIPIGLTGFCIRLGNFINQEITGVTTTLPWGVEFLHPADGVGGVVHPVQLYEGVGYLLVASVLLVLWRKRKAFVGTGLFFGLFIVSLAAIRFVCEFCKVPQGDVLPQGFGLKMGQLLSIPLFIAGAALLVRCRKMTRNLVVE